jgi:Tol biopolymer transport system component
MRSSRSGLPSLLLAGAFLLTGLLSPSDAAAQYFGRNKVQYDTHDFKVLKTEHFDIYYYEEGEEIIPEAARMAERWYARIARLLDHQLKGRQALILYTSHPDFEQTNAVFGEIGESTGGVTEVLKRRIVLPLAGPLDQSDHVIGHELVHAFQFDITSVTGDGGIGFRGPTALMLPLWFIEGMAEYLSIGPVDPHTAMWMRDAAADCCELPTTRDLANAYEYFPYRWGQAFWAFVAGRWGDEAVGKVLKVAGRSGNPEGALEVVLQTSIDEINREWHESIRAAYASVAAEVLDSAAVAPLLEPVEPEPDIVPLPPGERPEPEPDEKVLRERADLSRSLLARQHGDARLLFSEKRGGGSLNIGPSLSPDGRHLVFLSEKDLFAIEMFLADVETGQILRRITKNATDPHFESLQFINSAGAWSADGRMFAFGSVVSGTAAITIIDPESGDRIRELKYPELGEIFTPTFSPDGRRIAFGGLAGGVMDLFVSDVETGEMRRLTHDLYSDLQPAWSPDGGSIAFVTDRFSTDLGTLDYGNYRLAVIDPDTGEIQALPVFGKGKHIDPKWSPDGQSLYFITDVSGISNVYRFDFRGGRLSQVTDLITGVSGITASSPAISMAARTERLVYTAYEDGDYNLYVVDERTQLAGVPIEGQIEGVSPAVLPPQDRPPGLITTLMNEPELGLQDTLTFAQAPYNPKLTLDYVSQPVVGAGVSSYGSYFAGGISMYFSDMLGNRNLGATVNINTAYGDITKSSALIVSYENRRSRWNWFVEAGQIPYVTGGLLAQGLDPETGDLVEVDLLQWQVSRQVTAGVAYPFSRSHRWEVSAGYQNLDFSEELRFNYYDPGSFQFRGSDSEDRDAPKSLNQGIMSTALVYDNTIFGGTGPILGQRYRLEVSPRVGDINYAGVLADYRKYFMPIRPFTFATRLMHYGRYGSDAENTWSEIDPGAPEFWADQQVIRDLYLGYPTLIRGYSSGSFSSEECFGSGAAVCYPYAQLFGSRVAVANFEFRIPLLGFFGVIPSSGFPPLEIAPFFDAGLAWRSDSENVGFSCGAGETPGLDCREVVTSHGIAARLNLLGFLIMELDFVHPNNRPGKGWFWQFSLLQAF